MGRLLGFALQPASATLASSRSGQACPSRVHKGALVPLVQSVRLYDAASHLVFGLPAKPHAHPGGLLHQLSSPLFSCLENGLRGTFSWPEST